MNLVGLMHVRDEQWVLGASLRAALMFVDRVVVLDHDSTDSTPAIIDQVSAEFPGRVSRSGWQGQHYNEAAMRQRTLEEGRRIGGSHFFWIDADEIICHHLIRPLRSVIADLNPGQTLELPWLAMWESLDCFRDDESVWTNNFKAFAFADHPDINYRSYQDGYDMHQHARDTKGDPVRPLSDQSSGGVMHLQFANRRRLIAKHAWYKMSETVRFPGRNPASEIDQRYNEAVDGSGLRLRSAPALWWQGYASLRESIWFDDPPWHETEVLNFWRTHGPAAFEGLELWGLPERLDTARVCE